MTLMLRLGEDRDERQLQDAPRTFGGVRPMPERIAREQRHAATSDVLIRYARMRILTFFPPAIGSL